MATTVVHNLFEPIRESLFISYSSNSGVIIEVTSELPFGSGLGSSASLSVAVASAFLLLCQVIELQFQNTDEGLTQTELSKKDLDVINAWAFEGEKISHGLPSGIDNTIITYGNVIFEVYFHFIWPEL